MNKKGRNGRKNNGKEQYFWTTAFAVDHALMATNGKENQDSDVVLIQC